MDPEKTKGVPALQRALSIIELLATSRIGASLSELSRRLGLPKSSTHRLLLTLETRGYLYRTDLNGRYNFSLKLLSLANMALQRTEFREFARPSLNALMLKTGLTVHMAILEQNQAVLIDKMEPLGIPRLGTWIGKGLDLHCTGVGKALFAHLPDDQIDHIIRNGLARYNDNTIVSGRKLKEEVARIRRCGYAVDDEEETLGLRCIGAPILSRDGRVVAAISIAGTTLQISEGNAEVLASHVREAANELSALSENLNGTSFHAAF